MSLLREIQRDATGNADLPTVLRKCKILAARLSNEAFKQWVEHELNGYPQAIDLPAYRTLPAMAKGHFAGPFGRQAQNVPIPASCLPEEYRDFGERVHFRDPISSYASLFNHGRPPGDFSAPWPGDLLRFVGGDIYHDMQCIAAYQVVPRGSVAGMLDTVRNKILTFALEIEEADPQAGDVAPGTAPSISQERVTQIFNMNIYGGTNAIAAASSHVSQSVRGQVRCGDVASLKTFLSSLGVPASDIIRLGDAIQKDGEQPAERKPGKRVSGWLQRVQKKIADGTMQLATGAGGQLIAQAVSAYLGLG